MKKITFYIAIAVILNFVICIMFSLLTNIYDYSFFGFTNLVLSFGPTFIFLMAFFELPEQKKITVRFIWLNIAIFFATVILLAYYNTRLMNDGQAISTVACVVCIYNIAMIAILIMYIFPGPANEPKNAPEQ